MCFSSKFLCLCFIVVAHFEVKNFQAVDKQIENDQSDNYTFLIQAGYRPQHSELAKFIVSLQVNKKKKFFGDNHSCGGSILSARAILTAAHCITYQDSEIPYNLRLNSLHIVAGTIDLSKMTTTASIHKVKKIYMYPDYNATLHTGDLALLFLVMEIELDSNSRSVIQMIEEEPVPGTKCVVLGWGRIFLGGPKVTILTYADISVLSHDYCGYGQNEFICVGSEDNYETGVAPGDSGSPLICNGALAGVASFARFRPLFADSNSPSLNFYVNVKEYSEWILDTLENRANVESFKCVQIFIALYFIEQAFL